ncbi:class I SAM-dependent methyltransferase, partial [Croceitalea sp. MTPC5]|uniref:class I SAM-dependent methyltransferase n=1 Tax=Croceitalea sp. MTPC5 TaxID=3056565 RepID=UPI0030CCAAE7
WSSYVTGLQIPLAEMESWRDETLAMIRGLKPSNVLEVGVGSGLLMYSLLDDVASYTGLDISQTVIARHKSQFKDREDDVHFYHLKADQLDQLSDDALFDTIIVNSVCQYFPGIQYFENVLDKIMDKLTEKGSVFIGDIRNLDLHKKIIKEKLDYEGRTYSEQDIDTIAFKENELLISPAYFKQMSKRYGNLDFHILERDWSFENELSKYRYDLIISANGKKGRKNDQQNGIGDIQSVDKLYNTPFLNQLGKVD